MKIITQDGMAIDTGIYDIFGEETFMEQDDNDIWYHDGNGTTILIASYDTEEDAYTAYRKFMAATDPFFDFRREDVTFDFRSALDDKGL